MTDYAERTQRMLANAALHLGTHVPGYGRIKSVHFLSGERYYGFAGKGGVAMIDEVTVLQLALGSNSKESK